MIMLMKLTADSQNKSYKKEDLQNKSKLQLIKNYNPIKKL